MAAAADDTCDRDAAIGLASLSVCCWHSRVGEPCIDFLPSLTVGQATGWSFVAQLLLPTL